MDKENGYLVLRGLGEEGVSFEGECLVTKSKGQMVIEYDESANGFDNTKTLLVLSDGVMTLNRVGSYSAVMIFEPMRENPVSLGSPFGQIEIRLGTERLEIEHFENGVDATVHYHFCIGGEVSQNVLKLECRTNQVCQQNGGN